MCVNPSPGNGIIFPTITGNERSKPPQQKAHCDRQSYLATRKNLPEAASMMLTPLESLWEVPYMTAPASCTFPSVPVDRMRIEDRLLRVLLENASPAVFLRGGEAPVRIDASAEATETSPETFLRKKRSRGCRSRGTPANRSVLFPSLKRGAETE